MILDREVGDNFVYVCGRAKRSAEARHVRNGLVMMDFALAVDELDGKDCYVDCVAKSSVCEELGNYVEEGEVIAVSGRLCHRSWTDPSGTRRTGKVVMVDNVEYLEED